MPEQRRRSTEPGTMLRPKLASRLPAPPSPRLHGEPPPRRPRALRAVWQLGAATAGSHVLFRRTHESSNIISAPLKAVVALPCGAARDCYDAPVNIYPVPFVMSKQAPADLIAFTHPPSPRYFQHHISLFSLRTLPSLNLFSPEVGRQWPAAGPSAASQHRGKEELQRGSRKTAARQAPPATACSPHLQDAVLQAEIKVSAHWVTRIGHRDIWGSHSLTSDLDLWIQKILEECRVCMRGRF